MPKKPNTTATIKKKRVIVKSQKKTAIPKKKKIPRKKKTAKKRSSKRDLQEHSVDQEKTTDSQKISRSKPEQLVKDRVVIYENISTFLCLNEKALDVTYAKKIVNWNEESENIKFKTKYLLKDVYGKKIRCFNIKDERINIKQIEILKYEILRGNWIFNGVPIIIGNTGRVLWGKKRLLGFILAHQEWIEHPDKWTQTCPEEPKLHTVIVTGIDESLDIESTFNFTNKSTVNVVANQEYFKDVTNLKHRSNLNKALDKAVKILWLRTGMKVNNINPNLTRAEISSFIDRHNTLIECVREVYSIHLEHRGAFSYLGTVAQVVASLYLMMASATDPQLYQSSTLPSEEQINFKHKQKALDFVKLLADLSRSRVLRSSLSSLKTGTRLEKLSILCKIWLHYLPKERMPQKKIQVECLEHRGKLVLSSFEGFGGIDMGIRGHKS